MASLTILYWRDIPSQVIVKSGRSSAKRELSERFIRAIDAAAMHAGAKSDDAYLAEWRRERASRLRRRSRGRKLPPPPSGWRRNTTPTGWRFSPSTMGATAPRDDAARPRPRSSRAASGRRPTAMPRMRLWSVRHAALMERLYRRFEAAIVALSPLFALIGYARLERPVAALEAGVKGSCSTAGCAATASCRRPACPAR